MNIYILDSRIKNSIDRDSLYLNELDFHPCKGFFLNHLDILPESAQYIKTKGILENSKYIRYILKMMDAMLMVNGIIEISFFASGFDYGGNPFRTYTSLMYECSIIFKERIKLVSKTQNGNDIKIILKKNVATLPARDTIEAWSFGAISNGKKNERILALIEQVRNFQIPNFEFLICGPAPSNNLPSFVKIIDDSDLYFDSRIPISKKKNKIIDAANYNNLVLFHDRFNFPDHWYSDMKKYGNYFDGVAIPILDEETKSHRIQDWMSTSLDHYDFLKIFPKNRMLKYNQWVPNWNINGGFLIVKKHLIKRVKFNPFLHWGEAEDGDLCRRLDADGFCLNLYNNTYVTSQTHRLKTSNKRKGLLKLLQIMKFYLYTYLDFLNRKKLFKKYLVKESND